MAGRGARTGAGSARGFEEASSLCLSLLGPSSFPTSKPFSSQPLSSKALSFRVSSSALSTPSALHLLGCLLRPSAPQPLHLSDCLRPLRSRTGRQAPSLLSSLLRSSRSSSQAYKPPQLLRSSALSLSSSQVLCPFNPHSFSGLSCCTEAQRLRLHTLGPHWAVCS